MITEHAARVKDPSEFIKNTLHSDKVVDGVRKVLGKTKAGDGSDVEESYRFSTEEFTSKQAKNWMADNGIEFVSFEEASIKRLNRVTPGPAPNQDAAVPLVKAIPMDMSLGQISSALSHASTLKYPSNYDKGDWSYVMDIYLDGTVLICVQDKKGTKYLRHSYSFGADNIAVLEDPPVEVKQSWVDVQKAKWSAAYINDLPDSSFAHVESGGEKDVVGKTAPRSLRHLPYKDADGNIDMYHLRNTLAKAKQADLPQSAKDKITSKLTQILESSNEEKTEKGEEGEAKNIFIPISKKDEEKRLVYGVVLEPETVDAQDDIVAAEEIEKACHDFSRGYRKQKTEMGYMHKGIADGVDMVENYIAPGDFRLGNKSVKKGSWVMVSHIENDDTWEEVKEGKITGYSIGGRASHE
uniref:Putative peptidase n=1 Tax=viral metagenome TaxID=1070528 RepID=A0A6M3K194_9ZZZZ